MNAALLFLVAQTMATTPPMVATPWAVGETLTYSAHYGIVTPGSAALRVEAIDTVRGTPTWRFGMDMSVSILGLFKNRTELRSWTTPGDFVSLRFTKLLEEGGKTRNEDFKIYPDSGFYRRNVDTATHPTTAMPIDDVAFVYFLRLMPLKVGDTLSYPRYYRKEIGTVSVIVLGRETLKLPDGSKVPCLVLNPVVNEEPNGMFRKKAKARIWLTDDPRRIPVRIETTYPFGTVRLELEKIVVK